MGSKTLERPQSIIWFERLYLALIAIGLLNAVLRWSSMQEMIAQQPNSAVLPDWFLPMTLGIGFLINILFWYFIARRGSNVARWIYIVILVIGVLGLILSAVMGTLFANQVNGVIGLINTGLSLACGWLIFRPDAQPWFAGVRGPDLTDTFS
jgi:uncharacterized membrane protein